MTEPGSEKKCHTLIFSVTEGDKMYHVMNFHEYLQEKLEIDLDDKNLTKLNYDDEISRSLNACERTIPGSALVTLMVNEDFHSSYIIFATNA